MQNEEEEKNEWREKKTIFFFSVYRDSFYRYR